MTKVRGIISEGADGDIGSPSATEGLSASAAAAHIGVNERTVRRAVERGELPAVKVGGTFRIDLADLERFREQRTGPAGTPLPPADHAPSLRVLPPAPSLPPLPRPLTSFVGRGALTETIVALLCQPAMPLLSLIGPGGVGKTRLAQRVTAAVVPNFADGACFVALAAVTNPRLVMATVVQALGLPAGDKRPPFERLVAFLRAKRFLLVLDNFEQVTNAGPEVTTLLTSCHSLTVLVTSRIPLHVTGERQIPVPPLSLPATSAPTFVAHAHQSEAVRLFVERAQTVNPGFALSDETAPAVAEICRRLDGLPLAIELAAARSKLLSPSALLARLERRLPLLRGGPYDQPARLQTMHNAIAWSHDLLTPDEQVLFRRLAVFAGGCSLEAAEAVGRSEERGARNEDALSVLSLLAPRSSLLDGIGSLVDKSLVQLSPGPGSERRLSMLETVREFGVEQLDASGEGEGVRDAHAAFFLTLAEWGERALNGAAHKNWRDALTPEVGNFRAAQAWYAGRGDTESALRLVSALTRLWWITGDITSALRSLTEYLDRPDPVAPTVRAKALILAGRFEAAAGNCPRGMSLAERGLALARTDGYGLGEADAMAALGMICLFDARQDAARRFLDDAIARYRALDDRHQLGHALCQLALVGDFGAFDRPGNPDDLARSGAYCDEALGLFRAIGQPIAIGKAVFIHGFLASRRSDYRQAAAGLGEAIAIFWELHDLWELAAPLEDLADVAALTGRPGPAARLYGAVEALRETIGKPIPLAFQAEYERELTVSRSALGDEAFEAGRAAGRVLPLEEAVAEALALAAKARSLDDRITPRAAAPKAAVPGLTPREQDVLSLLRDGASNRMIAETLFIGVPTVKNHVTNILSKLGVESRAAAVAYAHRHDLD